MDNNFEQLIDFRTHVRGNTLDLVFSNKSEDILNIESLGNLGTSDHSILCVDVIFRSKYNNSTELIKDWKNGDCDGLRHFLSSVYWSDELQGKDTEEAWQFLNGKINKGIEIYIPKVQRRKPNSHQWMTKFVKRLVRLKQRKYNTYMRSRSPLDYDNFKLAEKNCKRAVRNAKRKFERNIANNGNKRPFNSFIKSKTKSKVNVGPLKVGNELITSNADMANVLNNAFSSVFTNENPSNIPVCDRVNDYISVSDIYIEPMSVYKKITKLKLSASSGPDGISSKFLSEYGDILSIPLAFIFNRSIETSSVPQDWREANVTPIFKKGAKNKTDNYRPVSLTSILCKILESLIRDKLMDHLINQPSN